MEIHGKYSTAKVFTDLIEQTAVEQIRELCNQPFTEGCRIRIMPDVHAGAGCVIGFTADLNERVIPNIVGVDIGCGMLTVELGQTDISGEKIDRIVREYVPAGQDVHEQAREMPELEGLLCYDRLRQKDRIRASMGTLGGGNHFIEVDRDEEDRSYLVIHTGSRNLGKQVADIYQSMAIKSIEGRRVTREDIQRLVDDYRAQGREREISAAIKAMTAAGGCQIPDQLRYLTGAMRDDYLHDMRICQRFASANRREIADTILRHLLDARLDDFPSMETVHNYVDFESNIIRKGAVSARLGERLLIPINMRDGSLVCIGRGNEDWNCSAPHGAGRLYSRGAARKMFSVSAFESEMSGVYTTSVSAETLDECPMAYKPMEAIAGRITPTVDIVNVIKPVYNFKAGN